MTDAGIEIAREDIAIRDGSDDDTVTQTNIETRQCSFPEVSYLKFRVQVNKTLKATKMMQSKFKEVFKCIRNDDNTANISCFKLDPIKDSDGLFKNKRNVIVTNENELPDSITALGKYFHGCRPRSEGGTIWTQIRLLHTEPIQNIIADTLS